MAELRRVFYGSFPFQGLFNDGMPIPVEFAGQLPYPPFFRSICFVSQLGQRPEVCIHIGHLSRPAMIGIQPFSLVHLVLFFLQFFCCTSISFFFAQIQNLESKQFIRILNGEGGGVRREGNGPFWPWPFLSYPQSWYHFWCASFWPPVISQRISFFSGRSFLPLIPNFYFPDGSSYLGVNEGFLVVMVGQVLGEF